MILLPVVHSTYRVRVGRYGTYTSVRLQQYEYIVLSAVVKIYTNVETHRQIILNLN